MKIASMKLPPPPRHIEMTFPQSEGWAIVAALSDYARAHPAAAEVESWREWAKTLDDELRR